MGQQCRSLAGGTCGEAVKPARAGGMLGPLAPPEPLKPRATSPTAPSLVEQGKTQPPASLQP